MDADDTVRAASSLQGKANKFERYYLFVLDKAHHVHGLYAQYWFICYAALPVL